MVREHRWSHMALISDSDTWFRDPAVYGWFDRLVDEGFFDEFDRVLFYGAGPCGYAAAAFSVSAPGAQDAPGERPWPVWLIVSGGESRWVLESKLMAREARGAFRLRIDDLDHSRARPEWETQIKDDLTWLGLTWEADIWRQSDRLPRYRTALQTLWDMGRFTVLRSSRWRLCWRFRPFWWRSLPCRGI